MKREFIPFYISRAALSAIVAILVLGLSLQALLVATGIFGLFLLYLHSGWFRVDTSHGLNPIQRDERAREIQRKALLAAVSTFLLLYVILSRTGNLLELSLDPTPLAIALAVVAYFIAQFVLLARA